MYELCVYIYIYDVGMLERRTYSVFVWLTHNEFVLNPSKPEVVRLDCQRAK